MNTATFNPEAYKATTEQQWQSAAKAWNDWGDTLDTWLGPATETMLDMARVDKGSRVLDVAAGAGGQSLQAARRTGDDGYVLATDISSNILDYAAAAARQEGLAQLDIRVMDGEDLALEPASFDAAISRVGLIYFPHQQRALHGILQALKPGGWFAAIVYSTPQNNAFFSLPVSLIRDRAKLAPPAPGQPGPFSLGNPGALRRVLSDAGFEAVEDRVVSAPLRLRSAAECVRFERESFGALHQMLSGLDAAAQDAVWAEIEQALARYDGVDQFVGPCELVIAAGRRPDPASAKDHHQA